MRYEVRYYTWAGRPLTVDYAATAAEGRDKAMRRLDYWAGAGRSAYAYVMRDDEVVEEVRSRKVVDKPKGR